MASKLGNPQIGGDDMNPALQQLLDGSRHRDSAIERVAQSVQQLSSDFSRKLDAAEHDTRRQFETFGDKIAAQFQQTNARFDTALATRDAKLEAVSSEFLKSRQAPWAQLTALGMFLLAFGGSIGWLAYAPLTDRTTKIETAIDKIADNQNVMRDFVVANFVPQKELEARSERGAEDRARTTRAIEALQNSVFPREVHQTRWLGFENQFNALNLRLDASVANLQREIDVIQKGLGDTYTARDALLDNRKRIEDLEDRLREINDINRRP